MLHAPTSENKTKNQANNSYSPPVAEQEHRLHPPTRGQSGLSSWGRDLSNHRQENLQKTYGNQAVLRMNGGVLQRKCACGTGNCADCQSKREGTPIVDEVLRSPGQPLPKPTRQMMESRFGEDLSQVRIHNNSQAAASSSQLGARAYTVAQHIVFNRGQYEPQTATGQKLIAHELAHHLQQKSQMASASAPLTLSHPQSPEEQSADLAAQAFENRSPIPPQKSTPLQLARDADPAVAQTGIADSIYDLRFRHICPLPMYAMLKELAALDQDTLSELRQHSSLAAPYGQARVELAMDVVWHAKYQKATLPGFRAILPSRMEAVIPSLTNIDQQKDILNFLNPSESSSPAKVEPSTQTTINKSASQVSASRTHTPSNVEIVIVKASKEKGMAELKESPAYYTNQILQKAGINAKTWLSSFTNISFLGRSVANIHLDLANHLKSVEPKLVEQYGGENKDPKVAGEKLGLEEDIGGAREAPTGTIYSMHLFGLAIDVNYKSNPFISTSANPVFERAGQLVNGKSIQYKDGMSYADLAELDKVLETYFSYIEDGTALEDKLKKATGFWQNKSVDDAQKKIKQDLSLVAGKWERGDSLKVIQKGGFLNLKEELVQGFGLSWGGSYGDMMHFDMRNKGSGVKISAAIEQYKKEKDAESKEKAVQQ